MANTIAVPSVVIAINSKNISKVKTIQQMLTDLGYDVGGVDGEFGNNTLNAVKQFQEDHKIYVDGEVGPQTWTALYQAAGYTVSNPTYTIDEDTTDSDTISEEATKDMDFYVGDQVKLVNGAKYFNGAKIPNWLFLITLYVRCINSNGSITVSVIKSGAVTGNVSPSNLILVKRSTETVTTNTQTVTVTDSTEVANQQMSAKRLVAIASAQIGYHEKASNDNLDDNTSNSGGANWTKYARDLFNAGYYGGGNKNGYAWCDVFVDWCFWKLANEDREKAEEIECQTGTGGAGCAYSAQYYQAQNRWSHTPSVGAQIFFYYSGAINHTGIVESYDSSKVYTIEGNTSDQVARRSYSLTDAVIAGYGLPKFPTDSSDESTAIDGLDSGTKVSVTANVLNVREKASKTSSVIGTCQKGDTFTVKEQSGTYGKIDFNGEDGWIDLSYVSKCDE